MESTAGTGIDTAVLTILGAAFGVMFATLTTLMVSSIRVQHRESTQTRQLITQASEKNRELIEQEIGKLTTDLNEHKRVAERNHDTVAESLNSMASSLGDAREWLARIEGILRVGLPTATDPESNGGTSEAA